MRNRTAIIVLDNNPKKRSKSAAPKRRRASVSGDIMDAELNRFLKRLARTKDFDGRQLYLPGFCPDEGSP